MQRTGELSGDCKTYLERVRREVLGARLILSQQLPVETKEKYS